jgi:septal ring factor EnvC (AmiA/AmiB activator)
MARYKHQLQLQTSQAADLNRKLEQQSEQCRELSLQLANTTSKLESLQTELLLTKRDNTRLNHCIDELECKLEKLDSMGQGLMTYSGRHTKRAATTPAFPCELSPQKMTV